jgi:hypothetical protein
MPYLANGEALCVLWVGNFFKPEYDDRGAMADALRETAELGFNGFVLDSKQWEDFGEYFRGGRASRYVSMQLYAASEAARHGLGHMFLALYLCGDNLYANGLRESPPILADRPKGVDGSDLPTYRYWSDKTRDSMAEHLAGLIGRMGEGHLEVEAEGGDRLLPMVTMFEPWVVPSFDEEGRGRYLGFLADRYGSVEALNERYGSNFGSFGEIPMDELWHGASSFVAYFGIPPLVHCRLDDFEKPGVEYLKFVDNQLWRAREYADYFKSMAPRIGALPRRVYRMPILNQWQMFFGSGVCWNNVTRAVDPWLLTPHIDSCTFNTLPADMFADADPYVVSAELAVSRSASPSRDFVAGLDICRFVDGDVYSRVPPAEAIASAAAAGAKGLHVYGYNGLDDGGSLKHMPAAFKRNVAEGVEFFKKVAAATKGAARLKEVAILYPLWMSLFQPYGEGRADEKTDFLGWFRYLCDLGYQVDVVHPDQVEAGALDAYRMLVLPYDPYYRFDPRPGAEAAVGEWLRRGGAAVHGAGCEFMERVEGRAGRRAKRDAVLDSARMLVLAYGYESFQGGGRVLASYRSGEAAAVEASLGMGKSVALGFNPGLSYVSGRQSIEVGNLGFDELYQFCMFEETFLSRELRALCAPRLAGVRGLERAIIGDSVVCVNHNPFDLTLDSGLVLRAHGFALQELRGGP